MDLETQERLISNAEFGVRISELKEKKRRSEPKQKRERGEMEKRLFPPIHPFTGSS